MPVARYNFSNITEWLTASQGKSEMEPIMRASRRKDEKPYWSGVRDYQQAIDYATKGWTEGAQGLNEYLMQLTPFLRTVKAYRKAWVNGRLPGGSLVIDQYVKGLPDCMLNRAPVASYKFARVMFNSSIHADIDQKDYFRRGAVIVALVHVLESSHYRAQVVSQNCTVGYSGDRLITETIVKDYNQSLDLDTIAFWSANTAVNRRISFSFRETLDSYWRRALGTG